jgi:Arc/MetJ family transcription regulator
MGMVKTPVEIDEEALATAAEVLGTSCGRRGRISLLPV